MIDPHIAETKTVAYYTLGCKLNFAETSTIGQLLEKEGFRKVKGAEKAALCVINTCTVTELADKKCRQAIRRVVRQHPGAFVVVTGCYAQLKPEEIAAIPEVDLVLGAEQKMKLPEFLGDMNKKKLGEVVATAGKEIRTFAPSCSKGDRTRYFLKVQDGCDYYCSYCTIPFARGRSRNGSVADLVRSAGEVAAAGGKEIVLTGVNIGDFGKSTDESFLELIRALDGVEGIERYRISSIEPNLLTDEIIDYVASSQRFAPHFHIPLQAGSDEVLRLMRRRYDTALFASKIERIKKAMPDAFIGVDLIVGVRGETEALFEESYRFVSGLDISQLHVFTYSERPNTRALEIEPVVTALEKHGRCTRMLQVSEEKRRSFYESQWGKERPVLFEQPKKGMPMHGFTDNYVRVECPYDRTLVNRVRRVILGGFNASGDSLVVHTCLEE